MGSLVLNFLRSVRKLTRPIQAIAYGCPVVSTDCPPRAYSAEGRTPEHRSREAQRAACRSAAGRRSRPPRAAASAESEGPKSPIIRRERAAGFGAERSVRTALPLRGNTTSLSSDVRRGEAAASELPFLHYLY